MHWAPSSRTGSTCGRALALAAGLCVAVLAIAAPAAQASFPGANGDIYYETSFAGGSLNGNQIGVLDPMTFSATSVFSSPTELGHPAVSPDGRKIAVPVEVPGRARDIYIMDPAKPSEKTVVPFMSASDEFDPAFSPDGTQLLFSALYSGRQGIYKVNLNGSGNAMQLTANPYDGAPTWSPDGQKIAFTGGSYDKGIYVMGNAGGSVTPIVTNGFAHDPDWSPDGSTIAYASQADGAIPKIWTVEANGDNPRRLTGDEVDWAQQPSFSPDGGRIAFEAREPGKVPFGMDVDAFDGDDFKQLTRPSNSQAATKAPAWATQFASAAAPMVMTGLVTGLAGIAPTLNGAINPNGVATTYYFEYGLDRGAGTVYSQTAEQSAGSGSAVVTVHANIAALALGSGYRFRLVARRGLEGFVGPQHTFTTPLADGGTAKMIKGDLLSLSGGPSPKFKLGTYDTKFKATAVNPAQSGATIRVVVGQESDRTYAMPAAGWTASGLKPYSKFKYKDTTLTAGPITSVGIVRSKLRFSGKGTALGYGLASDPGVVKIDFAIGSKHHCMTFDSSTLRYGPGKLLGKRAPAPTSCPQ